MVSIKDKTQNQVEDTKQTFFSQISFNYENIIK